MNTEEIMKLADAYANAAQGYNMATLNKARAALEAALSAKQVEQEPCKYCGETSDHDTRYCFPSPEAKARKDARAALEAALSAKQEQCSQVTSEYSEQEPTHWPEAPKEIYLVVCGDDDCDQPFREHGEVTWCEDMIHATDIRYVRADTHPAPSVNAQKPANVGALALDWYDQTMADEGVITRDALHIFALSLPVSPAPSVNAQLLEALKKIATVNAMDYEYQRWAKAAIAAVEGKV